MSNDDAGSEWREIVRATIAAMQALPLDEKEVVGGQFLLGLLDIWGITIAALVGQGVLEPHNLRRDLLGMVEFCQGQGAEHRAGVIKLVANNIESMITAIEQDKKYPPTSGRA